MNDEDKTKGQLIAELTKLRQKIANMEFSETKLKQVGKILQGRDKRFRELAELLPVTVYEVDMEFNVIFTNRTGLETFGYTQEELDKGLNALQIIAPEDHKRLKENFAKGLRGEYTGINEYWSQKKDGSKFPIILHGMLKRDDDGNPVGIIGIIIDITDRKRAEIALKDSEERYRGLYESSRDGIASANMEGNFIECNQAFADMLGYTKQELYSLTYWDLAPKKWHDLTAKIHAEQVFTRGYSDEYEKEYIKRDGTIFPISIRTWVIKDKEGNPAGTWAIVRDITERKKMEKQLEEHTKNLEKLMGERTKKLKESEEKFRNLAEKSPNMIFINRKGRVVYANKRCEELIGYTRDEFYSPNFDFFSLIAPESVDLVKKAFSRHIRGEDIDPYEYSLITKEGKKREVIITSKLIDYEGEMAILGIITDITERKKMDEELQKVEKLESIGILAGGIAHDFNNILTAILGNISLAKIYTPLDNKKVFERLAEAEKASIRAKDLTQQLLTFSKGGTPVKKHVSISDLLMETVNFALSGSNVLCEFSFSKDLWLVEVDEGQISQVINNLIINADQAMPEGGTVKVSAENITLSSSNSLTLQEGDYVKISIEDQGIGIPRDHLSKIFDPYFTTKHKGSGLGLTVAYSIIKNHGGTIAIESKLGMGSKFSIYLPASPTQILTREDTEKKQLVFKGKILVMDDEESIREALNEILNYLEYEVAFATNGDEAIDLYTESKNKDQPFDAVILDLTIPGGMGGKETIQKLLEIDPEVKAIVSSGYSTDPIMADFKSYGFSGVVAKPYKIEELNEALAKVTKEKDK
ncbi:MAG: PAS domain S-box protein [Promethearchaeota archaeon]